MGKPKPHYFEAVYDVTRSIPRGRVTNYGAIADYLALGSARMVGWALTKSHATHSADIPAHRVVNRIGELSGRAHFRPPGLMAELLIDEGVNVKNNKVVDFKKVFWNPSNRDE